MIRKHLRLKKIALGLAFAAIVVPTAQARVVIDGYPATASYTAVAHQPIASEISVQSPVYQLGGGTAIKLTGAALVNAPAPVSHITAAGAALANAKHSALPVPNQVVVEAAGSGGFNWSDAGIGASVSLGALLLLVTAVGLGRRNRTRGLASA
jgi:hypothetical protein